MKIVGFKTYPKDLNYVTGKYRIVATHRFFKTARWQYTIEIIPSRYKTVTDFCHDDKQDWPTLRGGTMTLNCPPQEVITEFLQELREYVRQ